MAKTEEPLNQLASDPIVTQILADCAQVSRELTSPSEPIESITRRRFLKGAIGAGVAVGAWSKVSSESVAQLDQASVDGETQEQQLVPVVEATSDKVWKDDALDEQIVGEMMDRAIMKLAGRDSAKEAWKDFVLPGRYRRDKNQSTCWENSLALGGLSLTKSLRVCTAPVFSITRLLSGIDSRHTSSTPSTR